MAQAPTREVHNRIADRLKYCANGLTDARFMSAIGYFHTLLEHAFTLAPLDHSTPSDELIEKLALVRPVQRHTSTIVGQSSAYPLPMHDAAPVFKKLDAQLAKICASGAASATLNELPRLLLQSMDSHKASLNLVHHTLMHGAEVAHNSVWTLKNTPWPIALRPDQKQSLETLLFLIGCAHDSIFTRDRGHDEAASALLLVHLLNLDRAPERESAAVQQAREDLIKIIYYTIVGGTYPIIPKQTRAMVVLAHQTENEESTQETTTDIGIHYPRDQDRRVAYVTTPTSTSSISPIASSDINLLKLFRLALTFSDVNATSNANILSSCATPPEQAITASSMGAQLSRTLGLNSSPLMHLIATASNPDPAVLDAALLCLGQGIRVALEDSWGLTEGVLMLKDIKDQPKHVVAAVEGLTAIYHCLVTARHHSGPPLLNQPAQDALYSAANIKNMLSRLITLFKGEAFFTGSFLTNGFNAEFSDKPIAGANFWPEASKIYTALAEEATALLEKKPAAQREFILNIMCIASYQHGGSIAQTIISPDFNVCLYVNTIGALQRTGLPQVTYPPRTPSSRFTPPRERVISLTLTLPSIAENLPHNPSPRTTRVAPLDAPPHTAVVAGTGIWTDVNAPTRAHPPADAGEPIIEPHLPAAAAEQLPPAHPRTVPKVSATDCGCFAWLSSKCKVAPAGNQYAPD